MNPSDMEKRKADVTVILGKMGAKPKMEEMSEKMDDGKEMPMSMRVDALKMLAMALRNGDWRRADKALCTWLDFKDQDEGGPDDEEDELDLDMDMGQ
jgi:hypothetical protein